MNLDQVTAAYGEANVKAFLRLIRERESSQEDDAYTIINGGTHFIVPPWVHPYAGQSAPPGRAAGAYQYIPHTWQAVADALGFGEDFRPLHQDLGAVYLIAGRHALDDVIRGDVTSACIKCRPEWTSLPGAAEASAGWTVDKAVEVFRHWGGTVAATAAAPSTEGKTMDPLSILNVVGAGLSILLPQVGKVFGGQKDAQNAQLAGTILDTISQTAGTAKPGEPATLGTTATAMEAMQKDPALKEKVQQAVVTHPDIIGLVEIGGGIEKAAERSLEIQNADRPFWFNPLTWVTLAFFPMMYMITYQVLFTLAGPFLVSNGVANAPLQPNPWYAVVGFDSNTRTGLINLIVGFVFGGVCGIWFGTTVAKQRSDAVPQSAVTNGATASKT